MIEHLRLANVTFLPILMESGSLYVSKKYGIAGHLCPCGCGSKIITPLSKTEWHLRVKKGEPTLYPSIGNWQLPCKSHYWIINGEIIWSVQWTEEQIIAGWDAEGHVRELYYKELYKERNHPSIFKRIGKYLKLL